MQDSAHVNQKQNFLHHESAKTQHRGHPDRHFRIERDAFAGSDGIHSQGQDGPRNRLSTGQGRDLSPDPAAAESGNLRDDLHGRLRHASDERGHQHQLHRRNGISARSGDVRTLSEYRRQPVEHPRESRMENRRTGHRFVRSLHAGRCGRMAALAQPPQGRRQTLRQTQPRHEHRISGRVGEVLPVVADRDAHRAPDPRQAHARHRGGPEGLRREHHLHRAHRRRDLDGSRRRHRRAGQGTRRLQPEDRL